MRHVAAFQQLDVLFAKALASMMLIESSDGGTARAITNGNGSFDISGLTAVGMGIGSIEGTGNYFLGSKTLTVGSNNLSTTVSGVIQDGGFGGGAGGSLTKFDRSDAVTFDGVVSGTGNLVQSGAGALTLTANNTYSGGTNLNGGFRGKSLL
jgi:autotransporter-associated beta strand protein